jgi:hypothetical protein
MSNKSGRESKYSKSYISFYFVSIVKYISQNFLFFYFNDFVLTDTQQVESP